jgi:hypothetical protein
MNQRALMPPGRFIERINLSLRNAGCEQTVEMTFITEVTEEERGRLGRNWKVNGAWPKWPEEDFSLLEKLVYGMLKYDVAWPRTSARPSS